MAACVASFGGYAGLLAGDEGLCSSAEGRALDEDRLRRRRSRPAPCRRRGLPGRPRACLAGAALAAQDHQLLGRRSAARRARRVGDIMRSPVSSAPPVRARSPEASRAQVGREALVNAARRSRRASTPRRALRLSGISSSTGILPRAQNSLTLASPTPARFTTTPQGRPRCLTVWTARRRSWSPKGVGSVTRTAKSAPFIASTAGQATPGGASMMITSRGGAAARSFTARITGVQRASPTFRSPHRK